MSIRRLRGWALIALVIVLAVGAYWYTNIRSTPRTASATPATTQIVEVKQGNLSTTISVVGELESVQQETLSFSKMSGTTKLATLSVSAGNTVTAGQVLATIDPAPYQQALDQAKSALRAAEEKLADLTTPATRLDLAKSDLAIAKAQLQIEQARENLEDIVSPDIATLRAKVAEAQRALTQAQIDLKTLEADTTTADKLVKLRDAEAMAAADYARLATESTPASDASYQDRLQISLNKLKNAEDARITAEVQQQINLIKTRMQVRKAEATLADAQEALATAQAGGDKLALTKAKVAAQEAEVALTTAMEDRKTLERGADAVTLAAAQADVDKKRLAVADAEAALAATKLTAPFAGTILKTNVTAGSLIAANTPILTMANLKALQVVAAVDETTIRRVTPNQAAQITFDAFPGQVLRGKVLTVPLQGALQGNVMVYDVPISLTGAENLALLVGMTANVKIQVAEATNALLVPALALQQVGGGYQVLVPNTGDAQGEARAVKVEVGLSDGVNTQILSGLQAGDKVLVKYSTTTTTTQNTQMPGGGMMFFDGGGPPPNPPSGGR